MADKRKPRILNVDDSDAKRYAVTRILLKAGFDVVETATGEEALGRVEERPDLVLLDVNLPDINGFEVCKRIKANPHTAHIPVVHLSASFVGSDNRTRGLEDGADGYLTHPVEPQELVATIKAFLRMKATEESLRESESRYRELFNNISNGVAIYEVREDGADFVFKDFNRAGERIDGDKREDLIGKSILEARPGIKEFGLLDVFKRVWKTGIPEHFPVTLYKDARLSLWYENFVYKLPSGEIVAVFDNVTERKRSEEELRASEEKYRTLVDNAGEAIFVAQDGMLKFTNSKTEQISGYTEEELRSRPFIDFMHPDDRAMVMDNHLKRMQGIEVPSTYPFQIIQKSGDTRWVDLNAVRIDWEGKPATLDFLTDITERKRAEEERKALERQLHRAAKMEAIGTLAGGIAHDFNNIMAIVLGNAELALDNVAEWNPAKDFLKKIRTAGLRAKDLTRQILAFSHHRMWNRKPVRISPIISDSLKFMRAGIPTTVQIRQHISCERDVVLADPVQINQVLMNLCANASHAMKESGGVLEVSLENVELDKGSAAPHQDLNPGIYVKLSVRDTGHGIDPKNMDLLFDPYFTTKGVGEGSGLGLSVVQGIVKISGGAIRVESEVGKGSLFEVFLPCIEGEEEAQAETTEQLLPTGTERILLVDDESGLVRAYAIGLRSLGYAVVPCTSALEALELFKAKAGEIDLVITDLTMPGMTGKKLARELIKVRPDIPIILCTGYDVPVSAEKTREMGVRASLMKPILKGDLANTIRKVLDGH